MLARCWAFRAAGGPRVATLALRVWAAQEVQDSLDEVQDRASRPPAVSRPSTRTCSLSILAQPTCSRPPPARPMARMDPPASPYYRILDLYRLRISRHLPPHSRSHRHSAVSTLLSPLPRRHDHPENLTSRLQSPPQHHRTIRCRPLNARRLILQHLTAVTPQRSPPLAQIPPLAIPTAVTVDILTRMILRSGKEWFYGKQGRRSANGGRKEPVRGRVGRPAQSAICL